MSVTLGHDLIKFYPTVSCRNRNGYIRNDSVPYLKRHPGGLTPDLDYQDTGVVYRSAGYKYVRRGREGRRVEV